MEICPERAKMSMILDENRMMSEGWSLKKGGDGKILRLAEKRSVECLSTYLFLGIEVLG